MSDNQETNSNNNSTNNENTTEEIVFKVFVGNISFQTTNDELKDFFKSAGEVKEANIITRNNRSLGYGFVSYATEAEANKAVEEFNKKELGGRQINVENAKAKNPNERRGYGNRRFRGRGGYRGGYRGYRGGYRGGYRQNNWVNDENNEDGNEERGQNSYRGGRGRGRGGRRGGRGRGRGGYYGRGRGRRYNNYNPRYNRSRKPQATGEFSDTTIYVANLPFSLNDDDLKNSFSQYNLESAKVIRYKNGKSKGFGFIKANSKEDQQKILNEVTDKEIEGRKLIIKIALASQQPRNTEEENNNNNESTQEAQE